MSKSDGKATKKVVELHPADEREAERKPASASVTDFVRENPLLSVAGGAALGAVVAALLPRGTGRRIAARAISLAEVAGAAGALLGTRVRETAESTGAGLREHGAAAAERFERLGESASGRIGRLGETAGDRIEKLIDPVESAAAKVARKASELRSRVRH